MQLHRALTPPASRERVWSDPAATSLEAAALLARGSGLVLNDASFFLLVGGGAGWQIANCTAAWGADVLESRAVRDARNARGAGR